MLSTIWHVCVLAMTLQTPSTPSPSAQMELPKLAARALSEQYRDWKPVAPTCPSQPNPISGDFNGDGRPDWAIQLEVASQRHLVVLIARIEEFDVREVHAQQGNTAIVTVKAGTVYMQPGKALPDYLGSDAIGEGPCSKPDRAHAWTGTGFRQVVLTRSGS